MTDLRTQLVAKTYDEIADHFAGWRDEIVAFDHVPRELLAGLFARIHSWLVPSGYFLTVLGTGDTPGWTREWLGATTFFSSYPPEVNRRLLTETGFELELDEVVTFREPEGNADFHWVLGRT